MSILHRLQPSVLAAIGLAVITGPGGAQSAPRAAGWVPGEVIFQLRLDAFESGAFRADQLSRGLTGLAIVDREMARLRVSEIRNVFNVEVKARDKHEMGMDRILLARYEGAPTPPEAAAALAGLPEIAWAEPNGITWVEQTPNDPSYRLQWEHHNRGQAVTAGGDSVGTWDCDIDTNQAWDIQTGAYSVLIAVVDTGIDRGHPEFSGRVLTGWDFVNNDSDPADDNGHGTSCAGIAAARGDNGQGVAGVAWENSILPVKTQNMNGGGNSNLLAAGIEYAADMGARVLSISVGSGDSQTLHTAVDYAYGADCVQVAAAGNDNTNAVSYPAAYDHVIAVGALSPCNERKSPTSCDGENWWGSNYGSALDFMAPGVRIHTTDIRGAGGYSNGDYADAFNGTSAATPFVAGIAALIRTQNPSLTGDQVYSILRESCDDIGAPGYDVETGWGRINAYVALRRVSGAVFVGPNTGAEYGTYYAPYNTVAEGVVAVPSGNFVVIKPGDYDEATPLSIVKNIHVDAIDGGVTIH